jgi:hypothetical protein
MVINNQRFFATLHFAQNDNYLDNKGKWGWKWLRHFQPHLPFPFS